MEPLNVNHTSIQAKHVMLIIKFHLGVYLMF